VRAGGVLETILLVEDEEPVLEVVRNLLGLNRYLVIEAHDGYQALAICTDYSDVIHLMITDIIMPQMNGIELAQRARIFRPDMKVLFMSGYVPEYLHQYGLTDEMVLLRKPFGLEDLVVKIRAAREGTTSQQL
jgi:two-component system, cell cycle sensor histidine kinase and response regulator CckA